MKKLLSLLSLLSVLVIFTSAPAQAIGFNIDTSSNRSNLSDYHRGNIKDWAQEAVDTNGELRALVQDIRDAYWSSPGDQEGAIVWKIGNYFAVKFKNNDKLIAAKRNQVKIQELAQRTFVDGVKARISNWSKSRLEGLKKSSKNKTGEILKAYKEKIEEAELIRKKGLSREFLNNLEAPQILDFI